MALSYPVGATVEKPIPILSCADLGIMSRSYGDFILEDLGINKNLSHMLGHQTAIGGGGGVQQIWTFLFFKTMLKVKH